MCTPKPSSCQTATCLDSACACRVRANNGHQQRVRMSNSRRIWVWQHLAEFVLRSSLQCAWRLRDIRGALIRETSVPVKESSVPGIHDQPELSIPVVNSLGAPRCLSPTAWTATASSRGRPRACAPPPSSSPCPPPPPRRRRALSHLLIDCLWPLLSFLERTLASLHPERCLGHSRRELHQRRDVKEGGSKAPRCGKPEPG